MQRDPVNAPDAVDGGHGNAPCDVSVLICSRDRAAHLAATLASIDALAVPPDIRAEVLVIDNGSIDGTAALLAAGPIRSMPFRWASVPERGKARCLNAAMRLSRGKVLLWTDDDVRVRPDWLERMSLPILQGRYDAVVGAVEIPAELRERLRGTIVERKMWLFASTEETDFSAPTLMIGVNMAFGRHVLSKVPNFDEALGPGMLGFAEDTSFGNRLRDAGYTIGGIPEAIVEHHFDASRISRESVDSMVRRMAESMAYVAHRWNGKRIRFPRLKLAKATLGHAVKASLLALRGAPVLEREELRLAYLSWCAYLRQFAKMQGAGQPAAPHGQLPIQVGPDES